MALHSFMQKLVISAPGYVLSDRGSDFTSTRFSEELLHLGLKQRLASRMSKSHAAPVERAIRTDLI